MTYSVFDQFEIIRLIPIHPFGNLDISITNSTLFMGLAFIFFVFLYNTNVKNGHLVPGRWQSVMEIVYETILDMVNSNIGSSGKRFFPFILTLFVFIALMNLFGIVPYTFAPTAHIVITFGLSLSIFLGCTLLGMVNHRLDYFSMFMPSGSPLILAPFLVIIEFVSHTAKAISLGVRLCSNITAGHLLFSILSGFTWKMLLSGGLIAVASVFPFMIVVFITVLEIGVAIIQAYVFSLLTSIYISEAEHLH